MAKLRMAWHCQSQMPRGDFRAHFECFHLPAALRQLEVPPRLQYERHPFQGSDFGISRKLGRITSLTSGARSKSEHCFTMAELRKLVPNYGHNHGHAASVLRLLSPTLSDSSTRSMGISVVLGRPISSVRRMCEPNAWQRTIVTFVTMVARQSCRRCHVVHGPLRTSFTPSFREVRLDDDARSLKLRRASAWQGARQSVSRVANAYRNFALSRSICFLLAMPLHTFRIAWAWV